MRREGRNFQRQDAHSRGSRLADVTSLKDQPSGTTALPCQGPGYVQISHSLGGRMEKRLPIAVVVCLSRVPQLPANEPERSHTDNVSPHGARVFSRCFWRPGEQVQVTTLKEESSILGEVIYCQRLDNDRFCIGLKFHERPVTWPTLSRYYRM
jgi:PilZ domain-containing protein